MRDKGEKLLIFTQISDSSMITSIRGEQNVIDGVECIKRRSLQNFFSQISEPLLKEGIKVAVFAQVRAELVRLRLRRG